MPFNGTAQLIRRVSIRAHGSVLIHILNLDMGDNPVCMFRRVVCVCAIACVGMCENIYVLWECGFLYVRTTTVHTFTCIEAESWGRCIIVHWEDEKLVFVLGSTSCQNPNNLSYKMHTQTRQAGNPETIGTNVSTQTHKEYLQYLHTLYSANTLSIADYKA